MGVAGTTASDGVLAKAFSVQGGSAGRPHSARVVSIPSLLGTPADREVAPRVRAQFARAPREAPSSAAGAPQCSTPPSNA